MRRVRVGGREAALKSPKPILAALGTLAALAVATSSGRAAADAPPPRPAKVPWVLTIRGGVSLGAYEAGFNWALVRMLKDEAVRTDGAPAGLDLAAVTGASAGSINALISALTWCQDAGEDRAESVAHNLFWDTWIPVGFEGLFPDDASAYAADDGLLTRAPFRKSEDRMRAAIQTRRFRDGCRLPVGVAVTKEKPAQIGGAAGTASQVVAQTQRFVASLDAVTSGGHIAFRQRTRTQEDATLGKTLYLRTDPQRAISVDDLFTLVEAASAFPVAFGPKEIHHCDDAVTGPADAACPDGGQVRMDRFLDGGVFDNQPLGLAVSLVTSDAPAPGPGCARASDAPFQFLYIDPDARRHGPPAHADDRPSPVGLRYVFGVAGNFLDVSSGYELQTMVRYQANRVGNRDTRIRPGTRFGMVVGEHLGHFAAFLAKPFRRYDYAVGVYDALYTLAERMCPAEGASTPRERAACVVEGVRGLHDALKLGEPGDGAYVSWVVRRLMSRELAAWLGGEARATLAAIPVGARSMADWVDDPVSASPDPIIAALVDAHDAIFDRRTRGVADDDFDAEFALVLERINRSRAARSSDEWSRGERDLVGDYGGWMRKMMFEAAWRQRAIEADAKSESTKRLLDLSTFALLSYIPNQATGLDLDPSSIPDTRFTWGQSIARLVPYYATTDLSQGGLELGYRPTLHLGKRLALGAPFAPLSWRLAGVEAGQKGYVGMRVGLALIGKIDHPALAAIELGPNVSAPYGHPGFEKPAFGAELALVGAMRKVRLSLSANDFVRSRVGADTYQPIWAVPSWSVRVGFADVNGMFYWLGRMMLPGTPRRASETP